MKKLVDRQFKVLYINTQQTQTTQMRDTMAYTKRIEILSNCPTQIINYNFITRDQIEDIRLAIIDCLKKYDMENSTDFIIKSVEISKKLKTTAGNIHWRGEEGAMVFEIKLAYNNLLEFGAESMIKTLRH